MEVFVRIRTGVIASFFVIAALLVAAPSYAQNKIGVIAGLNLSNVSFDPDAGAALEEFGVINGDSKGKTGFGVGIAFERALTPQVNLRLHGIFQQIGFGLTGDVPFSLASTAGASPAGIDGDSFPIENNITLNEFLIDAMVNLPVGAAARFSINAGLFFSFLMSQGEEFIVDGEDQSDDPEFEETAIKGSDAGLAIGADFKITPKIIVGALYRLGFVNRDDADDIDAIFDSAKTRAIMIYVIFMFSGV